MQCTPGCNGLLPNVCLRCIRTSFDVINRYIIDRHHATARSGLNGHIAKTHPAFHAQRPNRRTGKLQCIACTTSCTDFADDIQGNILTGHAKRQITFNINAHHFWFFLDQTLRRQYVLHLRGTDTHGNSTKRTVRRCMRVTADHSHTRQSQSLLRPNHMYNPLPHIIHTEFGNTELGAIRIQCFHLSS